MSVGLIGLIDDVVGIAKLAATSLDDTAAQATRASVVGFAAERELPIVGMIALGSLKNKLLYLMPAALALSLLAPWAITPLLMLGGLYLCFEGAEKVLEALGWHHGEAHGGGEARPAGTPARKSPDVAT